MNKDIKKMFDKKWAVVGFDYYRAIDIMSEIEKVCSKTVSKRIKSSNVPTLTTEFRDGTKLFWLRASEQAIGFRFGKMWCDERINKEFFNTVIMSCYTGKYEDIIWM